MSLEGLMTEPLLLMGPGGLAVWQWIGLAVVVVLAWGIGRVGAWLFTWVGAIWQDEMTVRFMQFGESSLDIEIMAWFRTTDFAKFKEMRQEVLLGFMQVVEDTGSGFAFPTRTVHLVEQNAPKSRSTKR